MKRNWPLIALLCVSAHGWSHGDLSLQLASQEAALANAPDDVEARFLHAQTLRYHEDWAKASAEYHEVLRRQPSYAAAYYGLGCLAVDQGQPGEAEAPLKAFLQREPKDPKGLGLLAEVYQKTGRRELADKAYAQANRAEPRVELYLERSQGLSQDGRLGRALEVLDEGMKKLGPLVVLEKEAISLERSLGRTDGALKRIQQLMRAPGRQDGWLELKGDVLAEGQRLPAAKKAWQASLAELAKLPEQRRLTQAAQDQKARLEVKLAGKR